MSYYYCLKQDNVPIQYADPPRCTVVVMPSMSVPHPPNFAMPIRTIHTFERNNFPTIYRVVQNYQTFPLTTNLPVQSDRTTISNNTINCDEEPQASSSEQQINSVKQDCSSISTSTSVELHIKNVTKQLLIPEKNMEKSTKSHKIMKPMSVKRKTCHSSFASMIGHNDDQEKFLFDRLHTLLRSTCIELFSAKPKDIKQYQPRMGVSYRKIIVAGQVGIRCAHCKHIQCKKKKAKQATIFPTSLDSLYESCRNWLRFHYPRCQYIPENIRTKVKSLSISSPSDEVKVLKSSMKQSYSLAASFDFGLVDVRNGIFFPDDEKSPSYQLDISLQGMAKAVAQDVIDTELSRSNCNSISTSIMNLVSGTDYNSIPDGVWLLFRQLKLHHKNPSDVHCSLICKHCNHLDSGGYFTTKHIKSKLPYPVTLGTFKRCFLSSALDHIHTCECCPSNVKIALKYFNDVQSRRRQRCWKKEFYERT